jgi:two-component system cell cycle response regulator DivK
MPTDEPARRCILIVEDDEMSQRLMRDVLNFHGYQTLITELPETAIEMALAHLPDLVLLDIRLPAGSGADVARRLKSDERTRTIPIIAVTAVAMPGDREGILQSGCDAYMPKPLHIEEFMSTVTAIIETRKKT